MTPPGPAARHDGGAGARSPFTGSDVCAAAGLRLVPGGRTVCFDQDVWDFRDVAGLAAYLDVRDTRLDFTTITDPRWRLVAKEYIYARLAPADPVVAVLPRAYRVPLTLRTCGKRLIEAASWMNWLTGQQIASLGQVTQDHCDRYLIERGRRKDASGTVIGTLEDASLRVPAAVIIELAGYGELFTADRYADGFTPWQGRTSSQVAGIRSGGENKTPPLGQQILQPLLAAAFYLTATLGSHVVALRQMVRQDRLAHQELRCWRSTRATLDELHSVLGWHLDAGEPLPALGNAGIQARLAMGWAPDDPLLHVSFTALANTAGARQLGPRHRDRGPGHPRRPRPGRHRQAVGTRRRRRRRRRRHRPLDPVDRPAGRQGRARPGLLPAHRLPDHHGDDHRDAQLRAEGTARRLPAQHRHRARPGPLPAGRQTDQGSGAGRPDDEWVVVEQVDRAVALAEQLCDDTRPGAPVFGSFAFSVRYARLRAWVNGPAGQRLGLAPIPDGPVNPRMMRRTLAQEIAYRPGGLLAAKVHLKHVSAATTEGYASRPGGAQAKLLAEIGEFEAERNLGLVAEEYRNYQNGIMPAGPGGRELAAFFDGVDEQDGRRPRRTSSPATSTCSTCCPSGPRSCTSRRGELLLVQRPIPGAVPDPGRPDRRGRAADRHVRLRALPAGHPPPAAPRRWAGTAANGTVFLGMLGRTRKTEQARLQAEVDRAQRVVDAIDAAQADPDPAGSE